MTKLLPEKPDVANLKKQAKKLLRQFRDKHQPAIDLVQQYHPEPNKFNGLRDAQLVIAREYGYPGWVDLTNAVELKNIESQAFDDIVNSYIGFACVQYAGNDREVRYRKAQQLLDNNPQLATANLIAAIVTNNIGHVASYLATHPESINQTFAPLDWPPIMYLCYSRIPEPPGSSSDVRMLQLLIDSGADLAVHAGIPQSYQFSPLTGVIGEGEAGVSNQPPHQFADTLARMLLEAGSDPNDSQALYNTMFTNSLEKWLDLLIEFGLDKQARVNWDDRPEALTMFDYLLEQAVNKDNLARAQLLVSLGANPNSHCHYAPEHSIYTQALIHNNQDMISLLEGAGAETEQLSVEDQIRIAVARRDRDALFGLLQGHSNLINIPELYQKADAVLLKELFQAGMDAKSRGLHQRTLLHYKCAQGDLAAVKVLLQHGADMSARDDYYNGTAIGWAHFNHQYEVRDYLLNQTTDTCLITACGDHDRLQQVLNEQPQLANMRTLSGNTPLHVVCNWLGEDADHALRNNIIETLLQYGADINATNDDGLTPVDLNNAEYLDDNVLILSALGGRSSK